KYGWNKYMDVCEYPSTTTTTIPKNHPPKITNPYPRDGTVINESSVELSVHIDDPDDDNVIVYFYDSDNNILIGKTSIYRGVGDAHITWKLSLDKIYHWHVKACDTHGACKYSPHSWYFTKKTSTYPYSVLFVDKTKSYIGSSINIKVTGYDDLDVLTLYISGPWGQWAQNCLGTQTKCTFSHVWTPTKPGTYTIWGGVMDNEGNMKWSKPVNVTILSTTTTTIPNQDKVIVFVTSKRYNGNLGGLAGADAKCQELANNAGLGGKWVSWLSDFNTNAKDRIPKTNSGYYLVDGTKVADDFSDLIDGSLDHPIDVDENGKIVGGYVWTGTNSDGTANKMTKEIANCGNWTVPILPFNGRGGIITKSNYEWTDATYGACFNLWRLYCFKDITNCHTGSPGSWSYCSSTCKCSAGQGDCDTNNDCQSGLVCKQDVGAKYGWNKYVDVCEYPSGTGNIIANSSNFLIDLWRRLFG
ncbi:MAG: DUF1554 domain-containing protein, partial [Candidatus Aenigmarchaeota archaeon]|nr:DUF1554 domain-containing protein [Candidatus Aenigmarchaeota archaeon]